MKYVKIIGLVLVVVVACLVLTTLTVKGDNGGFSGRARDIRVLIGSVDLSGPGEFRWVTNTMVEVKYDSGHTWLVDESNLLMLQ